MIASRKHDSGSTPFWTRLLPKKTTITRRHDGACAYSCISGATESTSVNSLCFCAEAVGLGSLMSCIYKRMTDQRLPYLVSRPFLFSLYTQTTIAVTNSIPPVIVASLSSYGLSVVLEIEQLWEYCYGPR